VGKGFFLRDPDAPQNVKLAESPTLVWLPPAVTAFGCVLLFFYAGHIKAFLMPIVTLN
jgi:multicomponent Na+:H+ antiporter subunit D